MEGRISRFVALLLLKHVVKRVAITEDRLVLWMLRGSITVGIYLPNRCT